MRSHIRDHSKAKPGKDRLRRLTGPVVAATLVSGLLVIAGPMSPALAMGQISEAQALDTKSDCIYSGDSISHTTAFSQATGHQFNCAMVFNDAVTTWQEWDAPWFEQDPSPDLNWADWKAAVPGRRLIITEDMVPSGSPSNWREIGATGAYDQYALTLAQNLVNNGLGDSVIRLGHELNETSPTASVGSDSTDYAAWIVYWQDIVTTMRSVPGADFLFDWNICAGYQNIPFDEIYPGDAYVDIISVDQYDGTIDNPIAGQTPQQRWQEIWDQPDGVGALLAFAAAHDKPTAFPEWGLYATGASHGDGDDPYYIDQMASLVENNDTAYQDLFNVQGTKDILLPSSLASYQQYLAYFGGNGSVQGSNLNPFILHSKPETLLVAGSSPLGLGGPSA